MTDFKKGFRLFDIVAVLHKSVVITLVERVSKIIIMLKPKGRKAEVIVLNGFQNISLSSSHMVVAKFL